MPPTVEHEDERPIALEDELHELESQERKLEQRTNFLETSGAFPLIFSVAATVLALAAFIVALTGGNGGSKGAVPTARSGTPGGTSARSMMGSSSNGAAMMGSSNAMHRSMIGGVGGHGSFTAAEVSAAAHGTVNVQLGDYWVAPTVSSVKAGNITFFTKNVGRVPHELMVERAPIKFDAPMRPNEDAAQGMIDDMTAGGTGHMTVKLKPGSYVLFCNAPGHYMMGQHILFRVTT